MKPKKSLAGIALCIIGLVLTVKPKLVWKLTESWKTEGSNAPSDRYMRILRIVRGAALGVGVLLLVGILK